MLSEWWFSSEDISFLQICNVFQTSRGNKTDLLFKFFMRRTFLNPWRTNSNNQPSLRKYLPKVDIVESRICREIHCFLVIFLHLFPATWSISTFSFQLLVLFQFFVSHSHYSIESNIASVQSICLLQDLQSTLNNAQILLNCKSAGWLLVLPSLVDRDFL